MIELLDLTPGEEKRIHLVQHNTFNDMDTCFKHLLQNKRKRSLFIYLGTIIFFQAHLRNVFSH